jgi:hypothetical protein
VNYIPHNPLWGQITATWLGLEPLIAERLQKPTTKTTAIFVLEFPSFRRKSSSCLMPFLTKFYVVKYALYAEQAKDNGWD